MFHAKCKESLHAENIMKIKCMGENTLSGIVAELGDIARFDEGKEIQKLNVVNFVACSFGKHK